MINNIEKNINSWHDVEVTIIRLGNIYRHMSCTNYIIITCSRLHRYPVYAAHIQIAAVDYEMQKDMPLKCDAAGEIM